MIRPATESGATTKRSAAPSPVPSTRRVVLGLLTSFLVLLQLTPAGAVDKRPPSTPSGLSASAVSASEIDLSWTASTDNVGVTGYLIERCRSVNCTNFLQIATTGPETTFADTGLAPNTTYRYRIRATDAAGKKSGYSSIVGARTLAGDPPDAPTAPGTLTAAGVSASQIDLSWGPATDNVGVTGYLIERCQGANCSSFAQVGSTTGTDTTYSDTGLAASTTYGYRVRATDGTAQGPYGNVATATTQASTSTPPLAAAYSFDEGAGTTVGDASGNGNTGTLANATWSAAGKYGNALFFNGTNARVTIPDSASLRLTTAMTLEAWVNPAPGASQWRDVIYKGNDNYFLESSSFNAGQPGGGGTFGGQDVIVYGPAALPANTWTHVAMTYNGATIRFYVNGVEVASGPKTGSIATSANPLEIGGDGIWGQYFQGLIDEVRVYNVALTAQQIQADMNAPVTPPGPDTEPPTAPGTLTATGVSASQINLSWGPATDNVGVTGYLIERCQGANCSGFAQVASTTGAGTTYADTGLVESTTYRYRVRATDGTTPGPYGNVASAATQTSADTQPPTAPGTLTATGVSASQINLSWGPATDNVGVTGYLIERCQGVGCPNPVQIATTTGPGTTYADIGLAASTTYRYRVRATDGTTPGPYSNVANGTTLGAVSSSLVAAYGFSEGAGASTVADASGNGNTGTIANASWSTAGKYGNALSFNGTNARVTIPNSAALQLATGMTLEAWVNPAAGASQWRDVIYKGNDNYYLESSSFNGGRPGGGGTFGGQGVIVYGAGALPANTWTHLAVTYDGAALRTYVNGVEVGSGAKTGNITTSTNPLEIGGDSLYGQFFQGLIDEVRVYNVALTAQQIQTDMNTPVAPTTPDGEPPTKPGSLTATTVGGSEIDLSWGASTDNVGVTGYLIERCAGTGCNGFSQIGTTSGTGTTYADQGLASGTYRYRVRATDATGNLGPYSDVAEATATFAISPQVAALTFTRTQQFTADVGGVTWSVDGVVGGSASAGTITAGGLYSPPSSVGTHTVRATNGGGQTADATVYVTNYAGIFTHHNDNSRTGQNLQETVLTPARVTPATFGKLFSYTLDGNAYASPLYVANVSIPGEGFHNVVYVATEHNTVYAFDADGLSNGPLWQVSFINPAAGVTTVPASDTGETGDISPELGITGTPVIDPGTNTLYVVAKTKEVAGATVSYVQRLHALDIRSGAEKFGGPVEIQASVLGLGSGTQGGQIPFHPLRQNQRPALLLSGGVVYVGFASHGDQVPWHGWLLGYNATTLQRVMVHNTTPNGVGGGIWQSGGGPAADASGIIYFATGNGTFDVNQGGTDLGDSFVKLDPTGAVLDFFTPHDQATLESGDLDLGSGGVLLLPNQGGAHPHLLIEAGKGGSVYLVDRDDMGHYNPNNDNQIVQSLVNIFPSGSITSGNFSLPVYYNGSVYFGPINDSVKTFQVSNGLLSLGPTSQSSVTYKFPGASMAISANGASNGILWAIQRNGSSAPATLRAYNAGNLNVELYNSDQSGSRDTMDIPAKYSIPTVANGKVFVGSLSRLTVYGLLP
jgi:chitodextrinase